MRSILGSLAVAGEGYVASAVALVSIRRAGSSAG